jgi:hypothetical protein
MIGLAWLVTAYREALRRSEDTNPSWMVTYIIQERKQFVALGFVWK